MKAHIPCSVALLALSACAGMAPPKADRIAALPVVTYPDKPTAADFVYKLPAGQPIDLRMVVDGTALAGSVDQTLTAQLGHDLYLHRQWASEDRQHWVDARKLVGVQLKLALPSWETPGPGELHLTVDRKAAP